MDNLVFGFEMPGVKLQPQPCRLRMFVKRPDGTETEISDTIDAAQVHVGDVLVGYWEYEEATK